MGATFEGFGGERWDLGDVAREAVVVGPGLRFGLKCGFIEIGCELEERISLGLRNSFIAGLF